MSANSNQSPSRRALAGRRPGSRLSRLRHLGIPPLILLIFASSAQPATAPAPKPEPPPPSTPRQFFNAGTEKLRQGKLREAEAFFESSLDSQVSRLQPPALYNLGHVRFDQGLEELKKGPAAGPTAARGEAAAQMADEAARQADQALAGDDVQQMVEAYLRGRGARHEVKAALKAVKQAMETHGATLSKWQRSDGDFRSTVELSPKADDARQNADTVERYIAKLVDSLRQLQQLGAMLGNKQQALGEKLKALRGRIPAPDMPPGAAGDDDDDEDMPNGPKEGQKEGPTKQGQEMTLSPEEAGWLLEGFKLDSERRLPMGEKDTADIKNPNRKPW